MESQQPIGGSQLTTANIFTRLSQLRIQGTEIPLSSNNNNNNNASTSTPIPVGETGLPRRDNQRPRGRLALRVTDPPHNGTSSHVENPFDLTNFRNELRIDGNTYEITHSDFEQVKALGSGASGNVQLMRHKTSGQEMAVKKMRRTQDMKEQKRIFTDLNIVIKDHTCEHIIKSYGAYITETDVCICMEPMDTCLDKLQVRLSSSGVKGIPENVLGKITVGVVTALDYLKREYKVIHRDVKPSNILIRANGDVKVCDFGIAGNLVDSKAKTRDQGCPAYMSPERIDPPENNPTYDIRADVWSLGITLVELSTGNYPYQNINAQFQLMTEILQSPAPTINESDGFSAEFVDFVSLCLIKDVSERPKYEKLLDHAFIKQHMDADNSVISKWYKSI